MPITSHGKNDLSCGYMSQLTQKWMTVTQLDVGQCVLDNRLTLKADGENNGNGEKILQKDILDSRLRFRFLIFKWQKHYYYLNSGSATLRVVRYWKLLWPDA